MLKKIILISFVLINTIIAQDKTNQYIDETKLNNIDINFFVGADAGYGYLDATNGIDKTNKSYSFYAGLPIWHFELIAKKKKQIANDFDLRSKSLVLNIPFDGSWTRSIYFGFVAGKGTVTWKNKTIDNISLSGKEDDGDFYGVHIGEKYKFGRDFFVRTELEFTTNNFDTTINSTTNTILKNYTEFIYSVEYRF